MSAADVELVREMTRPAYGIDLARLTADPAGQQAMRDHIAPYVHPEFEVELTFAATDIPRRGPDAMIDAWRELLSVFSSYRAHLDEAVDAGGGRVALFGHDEIATAEGIEMTIPVGAIYEVEAGRVRRARFFPDQAAARDALQRLG